MGQHRLITFRTCPKCGAQETTDAAGMAQHDDVCRPDRIRIIRRRKGLCVECGKTALPWTRCAEHRFRASLYYVLNRGARYGYFTKAFPDGPRKPYYGIGDLSVTVGKRGFNSKPSRPRAPRGFFPFVEAYLHQNGRPMHETRIVDAYTAFKRDRAARGHLDAVV